MILDSKNGRDYSDARKLYKRNVAFNNASADSGDHTI